MDLFAKDNTVLVPDPVYPVYVDTNVMAGRDVKFIDASGIRLEAEVKEPLGLDVFDYIEKNMGRAQYSWARPNDKVSVRLCCPMDSVEFYSKRGNGAK